MGELTEKQTNTWILASLAAPTAHLAAGIPWIHVLIIGAAAGIVRSFVGPTRGNILKRLLCILSAAQEMEILSACWPGEEDIQWVMVILLGLAFLMAGRGMAGTVQGGILLWWFVAALLGSVVFSGLTQLDLKRLPLEFKSGMGERELLLFEVLVLPCLFGKIEWNEGRAGGLLILLPVLCALSAQGILGKAAFQIPAPFYDLSRSIRLFGVFDRMEGLAWLGLMLGAFLYLSALAVGALGGQEERTPLWKQGIPAAAIILLRRIPIDLKIPILTGLLLLSFTVPWEMLRERNGDFRERKRNLKKHGKTG